MVSLFNVAWNGTIELFQVIDLDPSAQTSELAGRLTQRLDRNGYGVDIAYKTFTAAEIAASPSRQWQINTVSDDWGSTLSFTYNSAQQSGRWALSQVTRQDNATASFAYTCINVSHHAQRNANRLHLRSRHNQPDSNCENSGSGR